VGILVVLRNFNGQPLVNGGAAEKISFGRLKEVFGGYS